jgi:hypothetical protein
VVRLRDTRCGELSRMLSALVERWLLCDSRVNEGHTDINTIENYSRVLATEVKCLGSVRLQLHCLRGTDVRYDYVLSSECLHPTEGQPQPKLLSDEL